MTSDHKILEGNFMLSVLPMPQELAVAASYRKWSEKRLTNEQIVEAIVKDRPLYSDSVHALITVGFTGDMYSTGRNQLSIPKDFAEYLFVENDRGESIRCDRAELPLMALVGLFYKTVVVQAHFNNIRAQHPKFFETSSLRFVVGGIGFRTNTIVYRQPLSDLFADAPEPMRALFRDSGIW